MALGTHALPISRAKFLSPRRTLPAPRLLLYLSLPPNTGRELHLLRGEQLLDVCEELLALGFRLRVLDLVLVLFKEFSLDLV